VNGKPPPLLSVVIVAGLLASAVYLALSHVPSIGPDAASAVAWLLLGLIVGATLPGWWQNVAARLGLHRKDGA
jgi:hypothetical protein